MHAPFGNSQLGTGYACLMPKLVSDWREVWSKNSGTPADAPFGLVTLAASGGEGGADIGSMRLAQTGSYGVMPNPAMENTFLAQAGDLDDPVSSLNCYHSGCCTNMSASPSCTEGIGCDKICHGGSTPDYSWEDTPVCESSDIAERLCDFSAGLSDILARRRLRYHGAPRGGTRRCAAARALQL